MRVCVYACMYTCVYAYAYNMPGDKENRTSCTKWLKKNKPRGPAKNLGKPLVKQRFVQERGGQIKEKSYG